MGFDEPVDEERDPDDGEHGGDAVVVVEEDRPDFEGAFGFSVADLDEWLVFVDFEDPGGGDVAGNVGGERVDAIGSCGVGDGMGVAFPADGGFVGVGSVLVVTVRNGLILWPMMTATRLSTSFWVL